MSKSSTPAKRRRQQAAWTLLLSCAMVVSVEVVLRFSRGGGALLYDNKAAGYRALVPELEQFGSREIAVVGSSRTREAVMMRPLMAGLERRGVRVLAGNYALSGAEAAEVDRTVRHLLAAEPPPELVIYGVTPRQLESFDVRPTENEALFWELSDWWKLRKRYPTADAELPAALKNEIAHRSLLFRLRPEVRKLALEPRRTISRDLLALFRAPSAKLNPMRGGIPELKTGPKKNESKVATQEQIEKYLGDAYTEAEWPYTNQAQNLENVLRVCRAAGVPVILVEIPISPRLEEFQPKQTGPGFTRLMRELSVKYEVPYLELDSLGGSYTQAEFLEQSHLNLRGATRFTEALAKALPLELLPKHGKDEP